MRIGIDFDNTIAGYDHVFAAAAREIGFVPPGFSGGKRDVREALRRRPDGEREWMALQGQVYGARMDEAVFVEGADEFLARCRRKGVEAFIVSHKTVHGHFDSNQVDLRAAAWRWMEDRGFFAGDAFPFSADRVFFEDTRSAKIARLAAIGCTHFIDDLPEVFLEPSFPAGVRRYLLVTGDGPPPTGPFRAFRRWHDISHDILGEDD